MNATTQAAGTCLNGLRVIDLTQMMAGPLCTMLLGDLGADVVKIEASDREISRTMGDTFIGGESDFFLSLNRNKRSVVLDLKSTSGVATLKSLVAKALAAINPSLVYCAVSGFRGDGPDRDRRPPTPSCRP